MTAAHNQLYTQLACDLSKSALCQLQIEVELCVGNVICGQFGKLVYMYAKWQIAPADELGENLPA